MSLTIVFTGGGTAGHVAPNIALMEDLQKDNANIHYIGSNEGVEKKMITDINIPYYAVNTGKLRRYFSWRNFSDPFKIILGVFQSYRLLHKIKPNVVFSKGGFVAYPVVIGAWLNRIPVVAHESDMTPGLANRLSMPFVTKICLTFAAAKKHLKHPEKAEITGTPIRQQLLHGDASKGLALCGFHKDKPCLLIVGGSQGAEALNACVRLSLATLCEHYQVIHLCGRGKVDPSLVNHPDYYQFDYVDKEMGDLLASADVVVSRAGANALYELLALHKPHLLLPLSQRVSRGDQVQNARYFQQQGISTVINEDELTQELFIDAINDIFRNKSDSIKKIKALGIESATKSIVSILSHFGSHK
jgi:UDP-N-acetylglucosamine--N-acetylmuramyl-(pentapeptide) pyrophosphoryl-undecaprenol N-acetylglucosamine transferase